MKNTVPILLATLILSISMKDLAIYAIFKTNQEYLIDNNCINRFSPEELCFASCVLTQTIVESQEQHGQQSGLSVEQQVDVVYILNYTLNIPNLIFWQQPITPSKRINLIPSTFLTDIFQPPEC